MTKTEALNKLVAKAKELKRFTAAELAEATCIQPQNVKPLLPWLRDMKYIKFDHSSRAWNYIKEEEEWQKLQ